MTMRVNDVTMINSDGARDSTVTRAINWTMVLVVEPPWPKSNDKACAVALSGKLRNIVAKSPALREVETRNLRRLMIFSPF
jgi:hypothetical protein